MLLPHVKLFKKTKRGRELVSLPHFLHDLKKNKMFHLLYSINQLNFIVWFLLLHEVLNNMGIVIID